MKKFISVLLAILMVVAVMPFAIFAAEEGYVREKNTAHVCHPVDKDGNLILDAVDMADATVAFTKAGTDTQVLEKYLTDGKKDTATRLPVGTTAKLTITFAEAKDLGTLTLTVNGKGKINPGEEFEAEVVKDSTHNLAVKVVAYNGTTKVYEDTAAVDTTEIKDLVVNIFEKADKIEITTAGAAKADKGGPRLWEISATTVKGEADYDHDIETVVVKASTTKTAGKAYDVCGVCGYKSAEYDLPLLTADDLTSGKLTIDDVIITEELTKYDEDGKTVLKDDDDNDMLIDRPFDATPDKMFDGNFEAGNCWNTAGSFWTADANGKVTIKFKEARTIAYLNITMMLNSWPGINFEFYNGETLVGKKGGNWKGEGDPAKDGPDDRWTMATGGGYSASTFNFAAADYADLEGKVIDTIVIKMTNAGMNGQHGKRKIVEIEVGCHIHQYAEADIKANGTHGTGKDICKWTHDAKCIECEAVANDAIAYIHDIETTEHRAATCGNGIYTDVCKAEGCGYKNENYTVAGTGEHDYSTYVVQAKRANCGAAGTAYFTCATCKEREVIPSVTFKESEYEKAQEALEAIVANLAGKMLAQDVVADGITIATKYNKDKKNFFTEEQAMMAVQAGVTEFYFSCTDAQTGEAVTIKYAIAISGSYNAEKPEDSTYTISVKVGEAPKGLHTMGTKNIVPSTYTVHGEDYAYCTVCGTEFKDIRSEAALKAIGTGVYVRNNGFTLRTSEYEGIRLTMTINKDVIKSLFAGYSVRIWVVATNSFGETSEMQVYGAGAKNLISNDGKFSVVVKDFAHDRENIKFQLKISVKDANGEQVEYRDIGTTSLAKVREAGV